MNTRQFLKTLCLVPLGAVVEKLPGTGVSQVTEPKALEVAVSSNQLMKYKSMYPSSYRWKVNPSLISDWGNAT